MHMGNQLFEVSITLLAELFKTYPKGAYRFVGHVGVPFSLI